MKTVSQQFIDEQLKLHSKANRWTIIATCGTAKKHLTPYLVTESLNRLEQNVEETLITFGNTDIQFHIWYDKDLWNWLIDNTNIEIEVKSGFDFEKKTVFTGFLDRENTQLDTLGTIYVRAYGMSTYAQTIMADKPSWLPVISLRECVERLFTQLGIADENMTIKVKPIDLTEHAWCEMFMDQAATTLPLGRLPFMSLTDYKYVYAHYDAGGIGYGFKIITFEDDYTDFAETQIFPSLLGKITNIIPWDEDHFAVVGGNAQQFKYKTTDPTLTYYTDYVASKIEIYDYDGTFIKSITLSTETDGDYKYYPLARSIYFVHNHDKFIVGCLGENNGVSNPYIHKVRWKSFDATTEVLHKQWTIDEYFIHPYTQSTSGYWGVVGQSFYLGFMCPTTSWTADNKYVSIVNGKYFQYGNTGYNATQLEGAWAVCGKYAANDGGRVMDMTTLSWVSGFWSGEYAAPDYVETTLRGNYQYLTGYTISADVLQVKKYNGQSVTSMLYGPGIIPEGYTATVKGFMFWNTYNELDNFIAVQKSIDSDEQAYHNFCSYANRWFPLIEADYSDMNIRQVLDEAAKAFCCIYYFPDNDHSVFINREYLSGAKYPISPLLRLKQWYVQPFSNRKVVVNGVEYGDGDKLLTISTDFIPDNETIAAGIAKQYYDFIVAWDSTVEFYGDMLIQYEPLDVVEVVNPLTGEVYEGRIIKQVQEGDTVQFVIRGRKTTTRLVEA
jgi:hypothetical protein